MFTICEQLNPDCGSSQVSFGYASSVISGFDSKIDSCGVCGAVVKGASQLSNRQPQQGLYLAQ